MDRIAFVHIPKTAGRSVVHAFEQALGPTACAAFVPAIDDAAFATHRFCSGHVQLSQVTPSAVAFTFLRDPISQLASHLRWLDRYNEERFWEEVLPFPPSIVQAIRRVGETDFASARALDAFFDWLPEHSHARLRNVQCEVLAARADMAAYSDEAGMAQAAIAALPRLSFIGFADRMQPDLASLFSKLGLPGPPQVTWQNLVSSRRRIDLRDPAIRAVLARQVVADQVLYDHARAASGHPPPRASPPTRPWARWASLAMLGRSSLREA